MTATQEYSSAPVGQSRPQPESLDDPGHRRRTSEIAILTASRDRPYALGLASALVAQGVYFDFIGGDSVDAQEVRCEPHVNFFNLRSQRDGVGLLQKMTRVLVYYLRLLHYAATARPRIFHILWNNKFEQFDRTLLMVYYKLLGKKIVLTAHNVNIGRRDGTDSWSNHETLKFQYSLCDHIFVHTNRMKNQLVSEFGIGPGRIAVIPFGLNRTVADTALTALEARQRLGLAPDDRVLLFFGFIAPYKGLEYLVSAFNELDKSTNPVTAAAPKTLTSDLCPPTSEHRPPSSDLQPSAFSLQSREYRLLIAGQPKGSEKYWSGLMREINRSPVRSKIILKIEFVPYDETEIYFKAADVLVLPYTQIFQSGVLSLGYGFGLPVIAADVGSLKEEIVEGKTGFVFPARDSAALAGTIERYFSSDLYKNLAQRRKEIRDYASERYSWTKVAAITSKVYSDLLSQ